MLNKIICLVALVVTNSLFVAEADVEILVKSRAEKHPTFYRAMETNGFVDTASGAYKIVGLCNVGFNHKVKGQLVQKPWGYTAKSDGLKYCDLFKYRNGVYGKDLISKVDFRAKRWFLPSKATVVAFEKWLAAAQVKKLETQLKKAEQVGLRISQSARDNRLFRKANKKFTKQINSLQDDFSSLETNVSNLSKKVDSNHDSLTKSILDLSDKVGSVETSLLRKATTEQFNSLSKELVDVRGLLAKTVSSKDLSVLSKDISALDSNFILMLYSAAGLFIFIIVSLLHLVRSRKKTDEKVAILSDDVALLVPYWFDESLVTKDILSSLEFGESIDLPLEARVDGLSDTALRVESTGYNEVTIYHAFRELGKATPLVCGFKRAISTIRSAIKDGRIEGSVTKVLPA